MPTTLDFKPLYELAQDLVSEWTNPEQALREVISEIGIKDSDVIQEMIDGNLHKIRPYEEPPEEPFTLQELDALRVIKQRGGDPDD